MTTSQRRVVTLGLVILACFVVALGLSIVLVPMRQDAPRLGTGRVCEADNLPAEDDEHEG